MMLKHFLLFCMLAGLLSVCYSCGGGSGGNGGNGGSSGGDGNGGNGGDGGDGGNQPKFSLTFQTFDVDRDGVITLAEFLNLQPGHPPLFHSADSDGNGELTCSEFSREVEKFDGKAIC